MGGPAVELADASTPHPNFTAPAVNGPTVLTFRLTVSDTRLAASADVEVTVLRPNDSPQCGLAQASPGLLWPPNHAMVPVGIVGVTDPDNDGVIVSIRRVTQDEPTNGLGDGDTSPDAVIQGDTVLLRAERSGRGNGRVYHIGFVAEDVYGASCEGTVAVKVPHNAKAFQSVIDGGPLYDATQP